VIAYHKSLLAFMSQCLVKSMPCLVFTLVPLPEETW
jgi:hypothetical protein